MFISWPVLYAVIIKLNGGCICECGIVCPWHVYVCGCAHGKHVSVWHCVGVHMANMFLCGIVWVCTWQTHVSVCMACVCACITDLGLCMHVCVVCVCGKHMFLCV